MFIYYYRVLPNMRYDTAKEFAEDYVMVHTRAYDRAIYLGRVNDLTGTYLELDPAISQSYMGGSPTDKEKINEVDEGIPLRIDLEDILVIGKMPKPKKESS